MGKAFVGCSGYLYSHWRNGVFYPQGLKQSEEFAYYCKYFNTVELNSTFYRQPPFLVWEKWEQKAPFGFVYAVKMNRYATHIKKLSDPKDFWLPFWEGAKKLKEHLGPVLFQLPPGLKKDVQKLRQLAEVIPKNVRLAFEFRNLSWYTEEVYEVLKEYNWSLVIISHPTLPFVPQKTANFVYCRFHGKEALYSSLYAEKELEEFAKIALKWLRENTDVYIYFNNDIGGFAPKNALFLKNLLEKNARIF